MHVRVRMDRLDPPKPRAVDAVRKAKTDLEPPGRWHCTGEAHAYHVPDLVARRQHLRWAAPLDHLMKAIVQRADHGRLLIEQRIEIVSLARVILAAVDELFS